MRYLKRFTFQFIGTTLLFSAIVGLGTSLVLLASSCAGYLPYSDRPGPGWWGRIHGPSFSEIGTYIGFAPWFAYFCFYFGLGLFVLALVLGLASSPKWLNRILGGLISALAAGLAISAAGWYLALAAIGPDSAMALGLVYGVFVFPRLVVARKEKLRSWVRVFMITAASSVFLLWIVWPLLPKKLVPGLEVEVNRVMPASTPVNWQRTQYFRSETWDELSNLHLLGELHGGIQSTQSGDGLAIEVAVVVLQPIDREYRLTLPASGHVVYVLQNGKLEPHPAFAKKDKRSFILKPGADPKWDGGQIKIDGKVTAFTWYPSISR